MARKEVAVQRETGRMPAERHEWMNPLSRFRAEMDNLMEGFFHGFTPFPSTLDADGFAPRVDVVDSDKEIKVLAELPGMDEKDIEVSLSRDELTIKGEKKEEKEERSKGYYRNERCFGSFTRTIGLPLEIEADKAEASFKKGVLTVRLPKTKGAIDEARKIRVKTE